MTAVNSSIHSLLERLAMMSFVPAQTKRISTCPTTSGRKRYRILRIVDPSFEYVSQQTERPVFSAIFCAIRGVSASLWLSTPLPATKESPTATRRRGSAAASAMSEEGRTTPLRRPGGSGARRTVCFAHRACVSKIVFLIGFTLPPYARLHSHALAFSIFCLRLGRVTPENWHSPSRLKTYIPGHRCEGGTRGRKYSYRIRFHGHR